MFIVSPPVRESWITVSAVSSAKEPGLPIIFSGINSVTGGNNSLRGNI
jgi:hypothetical protein